MTWSPEAQTFYYPCPCGDRFYISLEDLLNGEDVAPCPSCSLRIRVVFADAEALEARVKVEAERAASAAA